MQGKWKNNVGGWNHKDSKRKKQTRNHLLKDRGLYLSRKEPEEVVRFESDVEIVQDTITKHGESKTIYKIRIDKYGEEYSERVAWYYGHIKYNPEWYDAYTGKRIYTWVHQGISIIGVAWQEYTHFKEPRVHGLGYRGVYTKTLMFIYNKPVQDWKRWTFYGDGKRRKYAQNQANSMDRQKLRTWINKKDWDSEMKTHVLSKSVAWEVC